MGGEQAAVGARDGAARRLEAQGGAWSADGRGGVQGADPRAVRGAGLALLLDRPALGRRRHRPGSTPGACSAWGWPRRRNAPIPDAGLRRLPDVRPCTMTVRHGAGRQPRRDRRAGDPHAARATGCARVAVYSDADRDGAARARGRRRGADRPGAGGRVLPRHRRPSLDAAATQRRRGGPSGLRVPVRARRVRPRRAPTPGWCSSGRPPTVIERWAARTAAREIADRGRRPRRPRPYEPRRRRPGRGRRRGRLPACW